jgi:aconitase B
VVKNHETGDVVAEFQLKTDVLLDEVSVSHTLALLFLLHAAVDT